MSDISYSHELGMAGTEIWANTQYDLSLQDLNNAMTHINNNNSYNSALNQANANIANNPNADARTNNTANTTISMSNYDKNNANNVTVVGTDGNDNFTNYKQYVTLSGGSGDDHIENHQINVSISGGAGNDILEDINLSGGHVTLNGGSGNDLIHISGDNGVINILQYSSGDGDDTVDGWNKESKIYIAGGNYTRSTVGNDIVLNVGTGSITVKDRASYYWASDMYVETVPAGTFGSDDVSYTAPTTTTYTPTSDYTSSYTSTANDSVSAYGGKFAGIGDGGVVYTTTTSTPIVSSGYVYAGGDQVISNYAGEQIMLGTAPTGAFFGGGNFALTSATGTLFIANANDKLISFTDGAGNPYAKAYAATAAGVIDGRGLAGYEVITGSDWGGDVIYAGDGSSQLWGGNGFDTDILTGGGGTDIFIGGRTQGSDIFLNASSADMVNLNDATLSDIVAASEANGVIALAFNTGSTVAVQSSELLSSAFVLADGSAYRYNHVTQSWQGA